MKTDAFITFLANQAGPTRSNALTRRFLPALGWGLGGAVVLLISVFGVRPDLARAASGWMFWVKPAFAGCLAIAGVLIAARAAIPGDRIGGIWALLATPVVLIWLLAAVVLLNTSENSRSAEIFGATWKSCPFSIAMLSIPILLSAIWAIRGLAPTRLVVAGASAGLLAGALAALVYTLHCPESTIPFLGIWYVLGIAIPAVTGALLGPRLLRW